MWISFRIFRIISHKQFKHLIISFIFVQYLNLFDFLLLAPTRFETCTDLHARSPIRRLSSNFVVADSDAEFASADKRSFCRSLINRWESILPVLALSLSLSLWVQVKICFIFSQQVKGLFSACSVTRSSVWTMRVRSRVSYISWTLSLSLSLLILSVSLSAGRELISADCLLFIVNC